MKKVSFLFFLIIFFSFELEADIQQVDKNFLGCNYDINEKNLKEINNLKIKRINVDVNNYRNWMAKSRRKS